MSNPHPGQPFEKDGPSDLKGTSLPLAPLFFLGAFGGFSLSLLFRTGSYQHPNEINGAYLWGVVGGVLALIGGVGIRALGKGSSGGKTVARVIFCLFLLAMGVAILIVILRPRLSRPTLPDHPPLIAPTGKTRD
jgi:hypothetical protein